MEDPRLLIPGSTSAIGEWKRAAERAAVKELPYAEAVALSLGDTEAQIDALRNLDDLGPVPLATRIRSDLLADGVKGILRGPQRSTRDNPLGLPARQADVLELLQKGTTHPEIADRLFISVRTVDHHVSSILAKLGVDNRAEAAERAGEPAPEPALI